MSWSQREIRARSLHPRPGTNLRSDRAWKSISGYMTSVFLFPVSSRHETTTGKRRSDIFVLLDHRRSERRSSVYRPLFDLLYVDRLVVCQFLLRTTTCLSSEVVVNQGRESSLWSGWSIRANFKNVQKIGDSGDLDGSPGKSIANDSDVCPSDLTQADPFAIKLWIHFLSAAKIPFPSQIRSSICFTTP